MDDSASSLRPLYSLNCSRLIFTHHTWQSIKQQQILHKSVCAGGHSQQSVWRQPLCFEEWVLMYIERQNIPADLRHSQCLQACVYTRKSRSKWCRAGWKEQSILEEPSTKQSEHDQSPQFSLEFLSWPPFIWNHDCIHSYSL